MDRKPKTTEDLKMIKWIEMSEMTEWERSFILNLKAYKQITERQRETLQKIFRNYFKG